jgi:hypothetical protein
MFRRLVNWFKLRPEPHESTPANPLRRTGALALRRSARSTPDVPRRQPESADTGAARHTEYVREDSGTHETLKIIDSSLNEADDEDDIDPYNTGRFDPSRNWDKRSR